MNYFLALLLLSWTPLASSVALYQQCGGDGYKGSTSCDWPLTCYRRSRWFSSCQTKCPGGDWECATQGGGASVGGLAKAWEQCGGEGWKGPRECAQYPCQWRTKWYAQCRPDCPAGWLCQGNAGSSTAGSTTLTTVTVNTVTPHVVLESSSPDFVDSAESTDSTTSTSLVDDDFNAIFGRDLVSRMLGDAVPDSGVLSLDFLEGVDLYDVLVDHIVEIAEAEEPGSMARFGAVVQADNIEQVIEAWTNMRDRIQAICEGPELLAVVSLDPLFADYFSSNSFENARVSMRTTSTGNALCDGPTPNLGQVNGKYGHAKNSRNIWALVTGAAAAGAQFAANQRDLNLVDSGESVPDPESRLGAYAATGGYPCGTLGDALHVSIGAIYAALGTKGEQKIGRVFNNKDVKKLYNEPVNSAFSECLARIERQYWANVWSEDWFSGGGMLGTAVWTGARDFLQRHNIIQRLMSGGVNYRCLQSRSRSRSFSSLADS